MQIIKQSEVNISEIVEALRRGKVIVYPTETCYGLGCDATNVEAVKKIFAIKQRRDDKSVLVLATDIAMVKKYAQWTPIVEKLADKYWPGPLTLVTEMKSADSGLALGVVAIDNTAAFRVTGHFLAHELVLGLGRPLVSTSANISGEPSPYNIDEVLKMFGDAVVQPDIIIDGGLLPHRSPSTVVRATSDSIEVLRQGELVVEI